MRRGVSIFGLCLIIAGCGPTLNEHLREYNDDGVYLYQTGDYPHARETFQAALKMTPDDANLYFNLASCYVHLGQPEQAESAFKECLRLAPDHPECWHAYVVFLYDRGRRPEAVQLVTAWKDRAPALSSPYVEDGYLWHRYGNLPQAVVLLEHALEVDPHDWRGLNELASVYEDLNLPDRALVLYERSLVAHPGQPDVAERVKKLQNDKVGRPRKD